MLIISHGHIQD